MRRSSSPSPAKESYFYERPGLVTLDFQTRIMVPSDSQAWSELAPELPTHATMLNASIVLCPERQYASLVYRRSVNGEPNHRKSSQRVTLTVSQAQTLIAKAYPASKRAEVLSSVITILEG